MNHELNGLEYILYHASSLSLVMQEYLCVLIVDLFFKLIYWSIATLKVVFELHKELQGRITY